MNCIIYVCGNSNISIYQQYNICAAYAKRYGYSIKSKVLDFDNSKFYQTVDKVIFDKDVACLLVYDMNCISDYETALFYKIYFDKSHKKLIIVS